jgi:malate dehydrogenase
MYPDIENAIVNNSPVGSLVNDMEWVDKTFLPTVQQRGKAVIDARGASSATSAAKAALDTIIACENPTGDGDCFSAAVASDGAYGVPEGLICGYPLMTTEDGSVEIIRDISLSNFAKEKFDISIAELESEREAVKDLL